MSFIKKIWKDRISEYPTRRNLEKSDGSSELVTVSRSEGNISQEGDAFSAENMNDLEERISNEFEALNAKIEKNPLEFKLIHSGGSVLNLTDEQIQDYHEFFVIVSYSDVGSGNCLIFDKMIKNSNNHVYSSIGRFTTSSYWFSGYVKLNLNEKQLSYGQSYASGGSFSRMEVYAR
jgi:hypothetical protein|nr:MAG TPA: hypothetical protein [Caudoviricetes sp.]